MARRTARAAAKRAKAAATPKVARLERAKCGPCIEVADGAPFWPVILQAEPLPPDLDDHGIELDAHRRQLHPRGQAPLEDPNGRASPQAENENTPWTLSP